MVTETIAPINIFKSPDPFKGRLINGKKYFVADPTQPYFFKEITANGAVEEKLLVQRGLVHINRDNAIRHGQCIVRAGGGKW